MAVTLIVGTNSWVTLAEANAFLETQFSNNWDSISSDDDKKKCLITAFWWLFNSSNFTIPKSSTNENVKNAQMLLADWIYGYYEEWKDRNALIAGGVKSFTLSKWREVLEKATIPNDIQDMLNSFKTGENFFTVTRDVD
jgi:hypothetical protein